MSPRRAAAWIAALLLVVGFVLTFPSLSARGMDCGSVWSPSVEAEIADIVDPSPVGSYAEACEDALSSRSTTSWLLGGVGGLALVFLFLTAQHATRWDTPASAPVNDESPPASR